MKPGEVRLLADGTPIKFQEVANITSLDNPCQYCVFENERCQERAILLGGCDPMTREDGKFGIFIHAGNACPVQTSQSCGEDSLQRNKPVYVSLGEVEPPLRLISTAFN